MPLMPEQREQVIANMSAGRLPREVPMKMYAGYGAGRLCDECGKTIDAKQVEYEAVFHDGRAHHLHLGCAGLWDTLRTRARSNGEPPTL
jgi:hypothetical protein